jgi:multiple sugar transport system permease protein
MSMRLGRRWAPYLFLLPFALLFLLFLVAPLLYALGLSLFRDTMVGGRVFAGLGNYLDALADPSFWEGVRTMLVFGAIQVPPMLALALCFALVLHGRTAYAPRLFRIGLFLPYAVPSVVAALVWGYLYGPAFGPAHQLAQALHLPSPAFLSARGVLPSLANIVTWEFTGYNMIVLYAALQAVPHEAEEAAAVDGATRLQTAAFVTVPMIGGALLVAAIFSLVHTLQLFNEPQIMAAIAPQVIGDHFTPNLYAYTLAFTNQQLNYAAAVSFTLALAVTLLACGIMLVGRRRAGAR